MNNTAIKISAEKSGFDFGTTERSQELVRRVYYVMKRKGIFYRFTRNFIPMRGLTAVGEDRAVHKNFCTGEAVHIANVKYIPEPPGISLSKPKTKFIPNILAELNMIDAMLHTRWHDNGFFWFDFGDYIDGYAEERRLASIERSNVLGYYTEYYLKERKKDQNVKPTNFVVEFAFGMIGVCLATVVFFSLLSIFVPGMVVLMFCFVIFILAALALCMLWD
jgi:hypothetical protein